VGRRVDFNPKSDSSILCFRGFYSTVNTPTKEKPKHKTPCCPHFFNTGLQSENFGENDHLFWQRKGQLWKQISRVLLRFYSACIYSLGRFFSQLFNDVYFNLIRFIIFKLEVETWKKKQRFSKFLTFVDQNFFYLWLLTVILRKIKNLNITLDMKKNFNCARFPLCEIFKF
jgi:hypothetical protein